MKLADTSIRRPILTSVVFLVVVIFGLIAFMQLPVDLMPDVTWPSLTVRTSYDGVGPEEIERLITEPIERALSTAPGVEEITSTSSEGNSAIRVSFTWGTDLNEASDEIRSRLDRIRGTLPPDASPPVLFKFDISQFPIMFLGVSAQMDPRDLRQFVEDQIQYRLERVPGVAAVDIRGGLRREIHVNLFRDRLQALGISPDQVMNTLRQENVNLPVGQVYEGDFEILVRTQGEYADVEQIQNTVVTVREGVPVYMRDIARVEDSFEEIRDHVRIGERPGIRLSVRKQSGANTVTVARAVHEEMDRINRDYSHVEVAAISDSSTFIENSIRNVRMSAVYGALLAVFVLLLFLRNIRSAVIIGISIPISVIGSFTLMHMYGFTLNTITFGGLALGVGMLVDSAIVVLENIFRHREAGADRISAASRGTAEVGPAIIAAALTTIVVFLPVLFMSGMSGVMYQQLAYVVSFSLICALVVAMTLLPMLCSRFIRVREPDSRFLRLWVHAGGVLLERLDGAYQNLLHWALDHRKTVLASAVVLFGGCLLLVPLIGVELTPDADEGEVRVDYELPAGVRLELTDATAFKIEDVVRATVPEAANIMVEVGATGGWQQSTVNTGSIRVVLVEKALRTRSSHEIAAALRRELGSMPGVINRVRASGGSRLLRIGQSEDRLTVEIRGHDLDTGHEVALHVQQLMESTPGISDARISRTEGRPETLVYVDRDKTSSLGLSVSQIANTLRTTVGGSRATLYREGGNEFNVLVRFEETDRRSLSHILNTPIHTPSGRPVPLGTLVTLETGQGPLSIQRKNQERLVSVNGNLAGRDLGSVVADLRAGVEQISVPFGFTVFMGGEYEEQQRAFQALLLSLLLAILLVYLVMAAQFESFRYPFVIMFSIPLATIGVVLMLFLSDTTFNMQAFIGVIMLAGIVVNNAIVLVDYVNLLRREQDLSLRQALEIGGRRRLRPILMTTMTTALALTPMSLGLGEGGELQAPMARVVIGGLLSSSLITLVVIPTLYLTFEQKRARREEEVEDLVTAPAGHTAKA